MSQQTTKANFSETYTVEMERKFLIILSHELKICHY
jgi:hypothetical protein